MTKYPDEVGRALAEQVAKELETYLVERRIERAEALLFINRHLVYDALMALSQGGALHAALESIDGEAPAKEPRDGPTVGFRPSPDPEQDDGNETVEEAFREGVARGLWEAAEIARAALLAAPRAGEGE